jgi:uncharacterized protein (DUF58 family)
MITWFLLLIAILSISASIFAGVNENEGLGIFSAIIFALVLAFGIWIKTIPEAIDVYRGNTTLRITYQDSIPVDSVVVFKK